MCAVLCSNPAAMTDELINLTIEDVVYRGKGLARHEGCVVFIPGVLPGESVTARITKQRKTFAEAELVSIEKASPSRIEPVCPLAPECPGCSYQHIDYKEEVALKQKQFKDTLSRQADINPSICLDPTPSPDNLGYRKKIVLHVQKSKDEETPRLGYFSGDNRTVIDVPSCPLAVNPINKLIKQKRSDRVFMRSLKHGDKVTFRFTDADGAICWAGKHEPGKSRITERTAQGEFRVHLRSFFQINGGISDELTKTVTEILLQNKPKALIDLFTGVGVLAVAAGKAGVVNVLGIDADRSAIRCATQNAKDRGLEHVEFWARMAEDALGKALHAIDPNKCTLIVDPPRRGLEKDIVEIISKDPPARIIYVSCAADTLSRDITRLKEFGYRVNRTQLFDMFPRTPHFESITLLSRV